MITLLSTWTFGLALGFVALGVFVSYKLFSFPDITTDGSFTLGAVVTAVLLTAGWDPVMATAGGMVAGAAAGTTTGVLHAVLGVEPLLAGILVTTALASVNLVVLGRSNVPLTGMPSVFDRAGSTLGPAVAALTGCDAATADEAARMLFTLGCLAIACGVLYLFFRTSLGTAMRGGGDTRSMARPLGPAHPEMADRGGRGTAHRLAGKRGSRQDQDPVRGRKIDVVSILEPDARAALMDPQQIVERPCDRADRKEPVKAAIGMAQKGRDVPILDHGADIAPDLSIFLVWRRISGSAVPWSSCFDIPQQGREMTDVRS